MSPDAVQKLLSEHTRVKEENHILRDENESLKQELSWLKRQIYGSKSERFISNDDQTSLALDVEATENGIEFEDISYRRQKRNNHTPHGREEIPAHLPREEITILPDTNISAMERIGEKVTEQLEYTPPQYRVKRYVRPVFAGYIDGVRTVVNAELPPLCNEKGKFGASFIAHATVAKFEDHTPLYRLKYQIERDSGMKIPESTLEKTPEITAFWIESIANRLGREIMQSGYVQIDESTLRVMIKPTNGKSKTGYMWLRYSPQRHIVVFDYDRHRNTAAAKKLVGDFQGVLQSDGYVVYDTYSSTEGVVHAGCHAHARRGFEKSKGNDKIRANHALKTYKDLFDIEKTAKEAQFSSEERLALRQERSVPLMESFKKWLDTEIHNVRPKSSIGKAILYCLGGWDELTQFLHDGRIEISNNLIENCVRPYALGRKNWLFAGSEDAARRMAIIYSVQMTCKLLGINFFKYLTHVLEEMPKRKSGDIEDLLPMNWKPAEN